jgi:cell division protein FtsL
MAQSSLATDWQYYHLPVNPPHGTETPKTVKKVSQRTYINKRQLYTKLALLGFLYALLLVTLCMQSATLGYQIEKLESDIQTLETENHRLDFQIAAKSSLGRVEWVALTQLGMYKPISGDRGASLAMAAPAQAATAGGHTLQSPTTLSWREQLMDKITGSWSRLAQNN